jgi:hypothetical protein
LQPIVAAEVNGTWGAAQHVAGLDPSLNSFADGLSCAATSCVLVGSRLDSSGQHFSAYVARTADGTWGAAKPLAANLNAGGSVSANAVSCARPGNCASTGTFLDAHGTNQAFTVDESTATTTSLTLSAARITFGHERAEHLTVQVTPRTGGVPSGSVTIKAHSGSRTVALCTIRLAHGKGGCRLTASKLRRGSYHLVASYGGDIHYSGSASRSRPLTVRG